jgi:hypothetical protein
MFLSLRASAIAWLPRGACVSNTRPRRRERFTPQEGRRAKELWELDDRPVPKGIDVKFTVNTNVPPPFAVQGQLVNTGEEA